MKRVNKKQTERERERERSNTKTKQNNNPQKQMASNRNNPQAKKQLNVKTIVKGRKHYKEGENKEK